MVGVEDFFPHLLDELPGCPRALVKNRLLKGAREFCRRSHVWRYRHPEIAVVADTDEYELYDLPEDALVYNMEEVLLDDLPILTWPEDAIDTPPGGLSRALGPLESRSRRVDGPQTYYTRPQQNVIRLRPPPQSDHTLNLKLTLMPALDANVLPQILLDEHVEILEHYVKWRSMSMPKREWTDMAGAMDHGRQWADAIGDEVLRARFGNVTPRFRTRPQW